MNASDSQVVPKLGCGVHGTFSQQREWAEWYANGLKEVQERLAHCEGDGWSEAYPNNGALLGTFADELVRFELKILVPAFIALATKYPMKERAGLLDRAETKEAGTWYGVETVGTRGVFMGTEEDTVTVTEVEPLSWVYSVMMEHGRRVKPSVFTEHVAQWEAGLSQRFARMGLSLTSDLYPLAKKLTLRIKPL